MVRQPDEHVGSSIDAGVVIVAVRTVDVGAKSPFWRIRNCVLKLPRRSSRYQVDQCLIIPVLVERHLLDGLCRDLRVNVRLFSLQRYSLRLDRDLLRYRAHL